ncbi:phosphate acyltransferase PlsX [Sandaracinobacteroides saxicola]|uniref:Phosphate acyltransferase n=1 Tax=Sandaracinobacteroides saxicola TaxID=2759707 RepID=A0A7G5IK41_9SPHN|nr:phosphate acyltransferase PlsX [Sandaracinobacteroides saxicola]QMW23733.1 phosphate acyltransferase PlsX [Sandaracinobacteroides saxicola]
MNNNPVIALDAMGGDVGPAIVIAGAELARERYPALRFRIFGQKPRIEAELKTAPRIAAEAEIVDVDGVVAGTDKPSAAIRRAKSTSMGLAIEAVKSGAAQAAVSAGNTGALMAMAKLALRTMEGIERPALVALMPTLRSDSVVLDLGANTECDAENLVQFAVMGAAFARTVLALERPKVALLNIGEEDMKGTEELKDAAALLRAAGADLPMEFSGFVEGNGIGQGLLDVIVTDGFSGNIALKTAEGTAKLVTGLLGNAYRSSWLTKIGYLLSRSALRALRDHLDPNNHNGAVFLGLNGVVVKSHGSATVKGFANAIGVAHDLVTQDIQAKIRADLANFSAHRPAMVVAAK